MAHKELILFDLGGVLVELGKELFPSHWFNHQQAFRLAEWFESPTAQQFETGKISPDEFIFKLKNTLQLNAPDNEIRSAFIRWIEGLYPGSEALIRDVAQHYESAVLSNTNALHESILRDDLGLGDKIDSLFFSHTIGMAKPNPDAFLYVLNKLGKKPHEVIFFDDNLANIAAATELGMRAHQVQGPDQVRACLSLNSVP